MRCVSQLHRQHCRRLHDGYSHEMEITVCRRRRRRRWLAAAAARDVQSAKCDAATPTPKCRGNHIIIFADGGCRCCCNVVYSVCDCYLYLYLCRAPTALRVCFCPTLTLNALRFNYDILARSVRRACLFERARDFISGEYQSAHDDGDDAAVLGCAYCNDSAK